MTADAGAAAPQPAGPQAAGPQAAGPQAALLSIENLRCQFGGVLAVRDATFTVRRGTLTGLIGPNGAGKSTVINLISGALRPDQGSVRFDGAQLAGRRPHEIARYGIVRTFQQANVFGGLTVLENLLVGAMPWRGERLAAALGPRRSWAPGQAELLDRAWGILRRFGLEAIANEYARALSGGQRRLVELMRALMARPKLLLLDEPMAGVSPPLAQAIAGRLAELRDDGMTMLMVEHELRLVEQLCDPVVVMAGGAVLAEGPMAELRANQAVIDAYLGGRHDS